jgi:hypothetical protein
MLQTLGVAYAQSRQAKRPISLSRPGRLLDADNRTSISEAGMESPLMCRKADDSYRA